MPELNIIGAKEENRYFPYQSAFRVTRKSFYQAGQDSFTSPPAQNPDMFQALTNVEPVNQGILKRRRGYKLLSKQSPSTPYREGFSFRSESLNLRSIAYTSTGNVLTLNEDGSAGIAALFVPSLTAEFAPRMVLSRNYGYFADGAVGDNLKWDGTSNTGNVTNWGIDINNVSGLVAGPNAPTTVTDTSTSGGTGAQGPLTPSTAVDSFIPDPNGGALPWSVPGADGGLASISIFADSDQEVTGASNYFKASNLGFSIPGGATITGIIGTISLQQSSRGGYSTNSVRLFKASSLVGTDHGTGGTWPFSTTGVTFGTATDLWGTSWTPSDINNSGFGIGVTTAFDIFGKGTSSGYIESITVTVYYTYSGGGTSWTNPNNIKVQDGAVATAIATTSQTSDLQATNFGFSAAGVISGIQVDIKCSTSTGAPTLNPVLSKASAAYGTRKVATVDNTSLGFISFGGPTDLWGGTWSLADVNGAGFGCQFYALNASGSSTFSVDFVRITVYSTVPASSVAISGVGITLISGRVYTIAFQNSVTGHVSHFTPFTASTGALTNQGISITNIPVSLDSQVDSKLILATADGGDTTTLYLLTSIPNATTTYADTTTDGVLLTQPVYQQTNTDGTLHGVANNKRPLAIRFPTKHKGRVFGAIQSTLYFSKNLDEVVTATGTITSKWEEAWPLTNQMDISETAETVQGILSDGETLWIATERCIRRLVGDSPSNFQKPEIEFNEAGLLNMDSWKITFYEGQPVGTLWLTPDFKVMASDFNTYQDVGTPIQDVLNTINPNAVSTIHASFVSKGPADYYMLHIPTGMSTNPDTVCVYSLRSKKWFIWKPTDKVTGSLFFIDSSGAPRWTFSTLAGSLYEWTDSVLQDRVNNTPVKYAVPITTSWLDFGDEGLTKAFNKIIVTTSDPAMTIAVQGAIRDIDLDSGGVTVLAPTTVQQDIFGDLFVPMVAQDGFYKWYQITFNSAASTVADVLDAFDFEIVPSLRM